MVKTGQREGQGLLLCPPRWPPACPCPGPRWLESESTTPGPVLLQPRNPCPLCGHPLLPELLRALGLRPSPLPLLGGPKHSPRRSQSLFSWGSNWLSARCRCCPGLDPHFSQRQHWCWPDTCVCSQSRSCLVIPLSACPLGVPRFGGLIATGDSTGPSTPCPVSPPNFIFAHKP